MLESDERWQRVTAAWDEARQVIAGTRLSSPFDEAGQERLLQALERAGKELDELVEGGLLGEFESALMKSELNQLSARVADIMPSDSDVNVLCYEMEALPSRQEQGLENLAQRLPLLEKMAAFDHLAAPAARRILETIQKDIDHVSGFWARLRMSRANRRRTDQLRSAALTQIERINARLDAAGTSD